MTERVDRFLAALTAAEPQATAYRTPGNQFVAIDGVWTVEQIEAALTAITTPSDDDATRAMR